MYAYSARRRTLGDLSTLAASWRLSPTTAVSDHDVECCKDKGRSQVPDVWRCRTEVVACLQVQLRLAVQRLRMLQEKKTSLAKSARRDIATLLERHKLETARVKTENIINEDIYVELLELLELYCELLLARFGLLDMNTREPDPGVKEGVCAVIFAAQRTELKELHVLREMLMQKYGREFSVCAVENREGCVPERVVRRVAVSTPGQELVDGYLKEIAAAYKIGLSELGGDEEEGAASGAGAAAEPGEESGETEPPKDEVDELTRRFEALKKQR